MSQLDLHSDPSTCTMTFLSFTTTAQKMPKASLVWCVKGQGYTQRLQLDHTPSEASVSASILNTEAGP